MPFEALQKVAIALSQERSLPVLLKRIVTELGRYRGVALARMWLVGPAEECDVCRTQSGPEKCQPLLHLAASTGRPLKDDEDWSRLNGEFHHGGAKVRQVHERGKPIFIQDIAADDKWIECTEWARRERIRSFASYPLKFGGQQVGLVAVFTRIPMKESDFEWLRVFAVAMAATVVNARAFDEIDNLRQRLESENEYLLAEVNEVAGSTGILGSSPGIRGVLERIEMVAPTDATVLILGETGVGKELVAHAIHEHSPRRNHTLVRVNCTAIPRDLFESEFFGHVKGAFSGALRDRMGRFQLAEGGTLFLDEVGDLPMAMQPKLLRVLQEGEFEAVGDERTRRADVRIIAASNHDLKAAVREGKFREDLYYRLSVFPIEVPPLRERKEDIAILGKHFVEAACRRLNRSVPEPTGSQIRQLLNYDWPGNVRELQSVIERAVITARLGSLHFDIVADSAARLVGQTTSISASAETVEIFTEAEIKRSERENIIAALQRSGGRIYGSGGAAELLGVKPTTLTARIKKLGLKKTPLSSASATPRRAWKGALPASGVTDRPP
jgi:transcriptional regulator with GAF, ATPase, and Fis domain